MISTRMPSTSVILPSPSVPATEIEPKIGACTVTQARNEPIAVSRPPTTVTIAKIMPVPPGRDDAPSLGPPCAGAPYPCGFPYPWGPPCGGP